MEVSALWAGNRVVEVSAIVWPFAMALCSRDIITVQNWEVIGQRPLRNIDKIRLLNETMEIKITVSKLCLDPETKRTRKFSAVALSIIVCVS